MKAPIEILLIIEADIATTQLTEQLLTECERFGINYKKVYLNQLETAHFATSSIPLFVRNADPIAEFWMRSLKEINKPFLYYIDDNFWLIDGKTPLAAYYQHPSTRRSLEYAVANAYAVITNSRNLQSFIARKNKNTVILPPFFDFRLIPVAPVPVTDEYRIGFAGSSSRSADLEILKEVIPTVLQRHPNVVFEFVGCAPDWLEQGPRVRFYEHIPSYTGYIEFQATRHWKIALAPLDERNSNKYKTNNKYREYSAFRYAGIYSNSETYADSVRDGKTGILVKDNTTLSWVSAIESYINDESLRCRVAQAAYLDAYERFDISSVTERWCDLFVATKLKSTAESFDVSKLSQRPNLSSRLAHYRLLLEISMYEGGLAVTAARIARRLLRMLRPGAL